MSELWDQAITTIQQQMKSQNFDIWLRPIECHSIADGTVTLRVPNRFFQDYVDANYVKLIRDQLHDLTGRDYQVDFVIAEAGPPAPGASPPSIPAPGSIRDGQGGNGNARPAASGSASPGGVLVGHLNARYRFDTFVVGPSNQLAHAASMAVCSMTGRKYNPLFIYGGVGLGKTHLVHAIGHDIHSTHPEKNIFYVSSEQFMNEFISSVRNQRQHEFQQKYRHQCDVLLMDDIQFIAGKDRTQDEFFHTFNFLYDQHKQIVVTCDKYPQEIDNLEERLRSRFQWGLIADIQAPELETRVAIVKKKADAEDIGLPDDVAFFLAENIRSNVRELEGSLIRLAAQASIEGRSIDLDFARHVLRSVFNLSAPRTTIDDVQRAVCSYYNIRMGELKGKSRQHSMTLPRMVAMYLCRQGLGTSFPEIGERFGGRDHTTVMSACRKIERVVETDLALRSAVDTLRRKLAI
jgi:chromosomal replication initiator protein